MNNGLSNYTGPGSEREGFDAALCAVRPATGTYFSNWYYWWYYAMPTIECHAPTGRD